MYFRLFASCLLVSGAKRSLIADVQRQTFFLIPNALYDILTKQKSHSLTQILASHQAEDRETIQEYFDFLMQNELLFWCEETELPLFPDIDLHYEEPARITNAIIDVDEQSTHNFNHIFEQLDDLGCKHVQIRFYSARPFHFFEIVRLAAENRLLLSVELVIKATSQTNIENLTIFWNRFPRLQSLIVHSAANDEHVQIAENESIFYTKQIINNQTHCGQIGPDYFSINLETFAESQQHNTCLNRKISIDTDGNIKNCPSMAKSYGNIGNATLAEALTAPGFTDSWFIYKDKISVCRDCEFRHICTDCRVYVHETPPGQFGKPAKCTYDPYTATWGNTNPTANPLYGQ